MFFSTEFDFLDQNPDKILMKKTNIKNLSITIPAMLGISTTILSCSNGNFHGFGGQKSKVHGPNTLFGKESSKGSSRDKDAEAGIGVDIDDGRTGIDNTVVPTVEEIIQVINKCENSKEKLKNTKQTLFFAQRPTTCRFGKEGNLQKKQAFITAFEPNPGRLDLPSGTVCTMQIKSLPESGGASGIIRYDDFLSLTLDGEIIFFSNNSWMSDFEQNNSVYRWDFSKIVGKEIGSKFEAPPYCIVRSGSCQFPGHDKAGGVNLQITTSDLAPIVAKFPERSSVSFNVNVTGDDNDTDCIHTPLSLEISMSYVP